MLTKLHNKSYSPIFKSHQILGCYSTRTHTHVKSAPPPSDTARPRTPRRALTSASPRPIRARVGLEARQQCGDVREHAARGAEAGHGRDSRESAVVTPSVLQRKTTH
jgi:hypothetical protein